MIDAKTVFYEKSVMKYVNPLLRRDLIKLCFPEYFNETSRIKKEITTHRAAFFCYLVILEANDDPFTVSERFEKSLIDTVFDQAWSKLQKKEGEGSIIATLF